MASAFAARCFSTSATRRPRVAARDPGPASRGRRMGPGSPSRASGEIRIARRPCVRRRRTCCRSAPRRSPGNSRFGRVHEEIAYLGAARPRGANPRPRALSRRGSSAALRERAEALNPSLNALVTPMPDVEERARDGGGGAARAATTLGATPRRPVHDQGLVRHRRGADDPRLPACSPTTCPSRDAVVVTRLVAAGGIPLAKTNLPDFALWWETDNLVFGRTRNPWNPERSAGGSSGGEAAAIGRRPLAARDRQRPRRLDPAAGALLRCRRSQADAWSRAGDRPLAGDAAALHARRLPRALGRRTSRSRSSLTAGPDGRGSVLRRRYRRRSPSTARTPACGASRRPRRRGLRPGRRRRCAPSSSARARRCPRSVAPSSPPTSPRSQRHDWNTTTMTLYGGGGGPYFDRVIAGRARRAPSRRSGRASPSASAVARATTSPPRKRSRSCGSDRPVLPRARRPALPDRAESGARDTTRPRWRSTAPDVPAPDRRCARRSRGTSPARRRSRSRSGGAREGLPIGVQLVGRHFEEPTRPGGRRGARGGPRARCRRPPLLAGDSQGRSKTAAIPWPPPMHIVTTPLPLLEPLERVHELHGEDRAGRSDRVAERDRAARDVERLRVEPDVARDGDRLCGERLVQLDEVDVRERTVPPARAPSGSRTPGRSP